jgi:NAD(P)-dependent dehydrogenase (short-subunit alcohol dehydrogenase family)
MDVNIKSVYYGALIAADKIRKRGGGVLINAASFASLMPSLGSGAYAASKAAVYSITKSLAAELAPFNIRVIGYIPGVIETEMTASTIKSKRELLESQIAMKRVGDSEEVANAVLFMASDKASYITGTFIEISGGKLCVQNPKDAWS